MTLDRKAILLADDLPKQEVQIDEWGGTVFVRSLTGRERNIWEEQVGKSNKQHGYLKFDVKAGYLAWFASIVCVDENGNQLFKKEDMEALGNKGAAALSKIWDVGSKLSGLVPEDLETLAENFDSGQS